MIPFDRETRIVHNEPRNSYLHGLHGVVVHLPGDPGDAEYPDGFDNMDQDDRWIRYENGECQWVDIKYLVAVE